MIFWILVCGAVIIIFGMNFDINNRYEPTEEIVAAAKSRNGCSSTLAAGREVYPDVAAENAKDLELSQNQADEENFKWEAYPLVDPLLIPDHFPEPVRFLMATAYTWAFAMLILPFFFGPTISMIKALRSKN